MSEKNERSEELRKLQKKVGLKRKPVELLSEDDLAGIVSGGESASCCNESKPLPP